MKETKSLKTNNVFAWILLLKLFVSFYPVIQSWAEQKKKLLTLVHHSLTPPFSFISLSFLWQGIMQLGGDQRAVGCSYQILHVTTKKPHEKPQSQLTSIEHRQSIIKEFSVLLLTHLIIDNHHGSLFSHWTKLPSKNIAYNTKITGTQNI